MHTNTGTSGKTYCGFNASTYLKHFILLLLCCCAHSSIQSRFDIYIFFRPAFSHSSSALMYVRVFRFRAISLLKLPIINFRKKKFFFRHTHVVVHRTHKSPGFDRNKKLPAKISKKKVTQDINAHTHTVKRKRRNLTIINQFSIFRLHLTLCALVTKSALNQ